MSAQAVTVHAYDSNFTLLGQVQYESAEFDQRLNDAGVGKVVVPMLAVGVEYIDYGCFLQFRVDGTHKYACMVEEIEIVWSGASPSNKVMTASGRGIVAQFSDALLRPPWGTGSLPAADTVYFNYAHPYLDRSSWTAPVQIQSVFEGAFYNPTKGGQLLAYGPPSARKEPKGFPDIWSHWIWSRAVDGGGFHPVGTSYFTNYFYAPTTAPTTFICSADDTGEWWIDNAYFIKTEDYRVAYSFGCYLTAGWHRLDVRATNVKPNSPAGIAVCGFQQVNSRYLTFDNCILRSGSNLAHGVWTTQSSPGVYVTWDGWLCRDYPNPEPGFTAGRILIWLLSAAQARGELPGWTVNFTSATDSAGNAWPILPEVSFRVGDDILSCLKALSDKGYVDFRANSNQRALSCWIGGRMGNYHTSPVSPPTWSQPAGNVISASVKGTR